MWIRSFLHTRCFFYLWHFLTNHFNVFQWELRHGGVCWNWAIFANKLFKNVILPSHLPYPFLWKKHFFLTNYFNIIQWEKRHNRICRNRAIFVDHRLHVLRAAAAQREGVALVGTDLILDAADARFRPDANVVPEKDDLIKNSFVRIELQWTPVNRIMDNRIIG